MEKDEINNSPNLEINLSEAQKKELLERFRQERENTKENNTIETNKTIKKSEISREDLWKRLLETKNESISKREQMKIQKDIENVQKSCTFQPTISITSKPVEDRLYEDGLTHFWNREKLTRERFDNENYSFKPEIKNDVKGEKALDKPIYERINELVRQKQENLHRLREKAYNDPSLTFKPQVNSMSNKIAEAKLEGGDVVERLLQDASNKVMKRIEMAEKKESEMSQVYTFVPNIVRSKENIGNPNDFATRQYLIADELRDKMQKRMQEHISQFSFKPNINPVSEILIEANHQRENETDYDKINRLSKLDNEKKEILKQELENAYYQQFNFVPKINEISKTIGQSRTVDELADNKDKSLHIKNLQEMAERAKLEQCTFQPEIKKKEKFEHVQSKYKKGENILEKIKEDEIKKIKKLNEIQRDSEYKQIKDCTFQPNLLKSKNKNNNNSTFQSSESVIRGLDRVIELRELREKKKKEKEKREEELFYLEKKYDSKNRTKTTNPKPFDLSKSNSKSYAQSRAEYFDKNQYSFQPNTNEKDRRKMLRKIIENMPTDNSTSH